MTLPVIVDENGQLGTAASSERFKAEIKPMNESSEAILALKPTTFHYKNDSKRTPQFGFVADKSRRLTQDRGQSGDQTAKYYTVR